MPKQQTQVSGLLKKLGDAGRKAHEAHKTDETKYGSGGELPDGIEGGIAELRLCKFGEYEKGELKGKLYFMAQGVVLSPETFKNQKIQGLRTQIGPEALCDTPKKSRKTVDDHVAWVLNELRKLGVQTDTINFDDLESVAAALQEAKPQFRFRTWKGEKATEGPYKDQEPRVNHEWRGLYESNGEAPASDAVADNTETVTDDQVEDQTGDDTSSDDASSESSESTGEEVDLDALVAAAQDKSNKPALIAAQKQIKEMALAAGITEAEFDELPGWEEVAAAIRDKQSSGDDDSSGSAGDEFTPEKGNVVFYYPPDKTGKPSKNAVEVEILAVMSKSETVNLKNLDDGKSQYKNVAWADLVRDKPKGKK